MAEMMKWNPFNDITGFFDEVDKLFDHFLKSFSQEIQAVQTAGRIMKLDVRDEGKELIITGDIPPNLKDNLDVVVHHNTVVIIGETSWEKQAEGKEYHWTKFTRACSLPAKVKSEGAKVDMKDDKITIRVPKE